MRILFVTPYPPSRIRVRGYGFLTHLQQEHDVTILAQCASEQEMNNVEALRQQGYRVAVVQESKKQQTLRSGLALLSLTPLQVAYARSAQFAQEIQRLCTQECFDVIHVEHLRGIASLLEIRRDTLATALPPVVWDAVDCISLLCEQTIKEGASLSVRAVAMIEYKRTEHSEADLVERFRHVAITSERDRQAMIELHRKYVGSTPPNSQDIGEFIRVVPNGVDLNYFKPLGAERKTANLVFSGKMSYHANVAAALYLCAEIMPLIWQQRPETKLTIVGSNPPGSIRKLAENPRIEVTGYVDDIRPYVGRAEVVVSPMVYSVGIQNKVLEAMAMGTPVVAATQAARALGAQPGRDYMVASSAQEFAQKTLYLMEHAEKRAELGENGRRYVEEHHSWSSVTEKLVEMYQEAIGVRAGKQEPHPVVGTR